MFYQMFSGSLGLIAAVIVGFYAFKTVRSAYPGEVSESKVKPDKEKQSKKSLLSRLRPESIHEISVRFSRYLIVTTLFLFVPSCITMLEKSKHGPDVAFKWILLNGDIMTCVLCATLFFSFIAVMTYEMRRGDYKILDD